MPERPLAGRMATAIENAHLLLCHLEATDAPSTTNSFFTQVYRELTQLLGEAEAAGLFEDEETEDV